MKKFNEMIGQEQFKKVMSVLINSSKKQDGMIDHLLINGEDGMGKVSWAKAIANEFDKDIRYISGNQLIKKADILAIFGAVSKGDFICIEHIEDISETSKKLLNGIIESGTADIAIGPKGAEKIIRMKIPPFSLIATSTKGIPDTSWFGIVSTFKKYSKENLLTILKDAFDETSLKVENKVLNQISTHISKPDEIVKVVKWIQVYSRCNEVEEVDTNIVLDMFESLELSPQNHAPINTKTL